MASLIHSVIFIQKLKASTHGGVIALTHEKNNAGWRIDYFVVSESLNERLVSAKIHTDILGSDHCPVEVVLDF